MSKSQIDQNSTSIELLKKDITYMKTGIDDIKSSMSELRHEITDGFATKQELKSLNERVGKMENLKDWAIKIVVGSIIVGLLTIMGIQR